MRYQPSQFSDPTRGIRSMSGFQFSPTSSRPSTRPTTPTTPAVKSPQTRERTLSAPPGHHSMHASKPQSRETASPTHKYQPSPLASTSPPENRLPLNDVTYQQVFIFHKSAPTPKRRPSGTGRPPLAPSTPPSSYVRNSIFTSRTPSPKAPARPSSSSNSTPFPNPTTNTHTQTYPNFHPHQPAAHDQRSSPSYTPLVIPPPSISARASNVSPQPVLSRSNPVKPLEVFSHHPLDCDTLLDVPASPESKDAPSSLPPWKYKPPPSPMASLRNPSPSLPPSPAAMPSPSKSKSYQYHYSVLPAPIMMDGTVGAYSIPGVAETFVPLLSLPPRTKPNPPNGTVPQVSMTNLTRQGSRKSNGRSRGYHDHSPSSSAVQIPFVVMDSADLSYSVPRNAVVMSPRAPPRLPPRNT
jgi:hypothetical protein